MTELRQKMIESLQLRGLSERTQDSYVRAVRQPADHYHREVAARRRDRGTPLCGSGLPKLWMIVNSPYGSSNGTMNGIYSRPIGERRNFTGFTGFFWNGRAWILFSGP